jgi:hypothetical protein
MIGSVKRPSSHLLTILTVVTSVSLALIAEEICKILAA